MAILNLANIWLIIINIFISHDHINNLELIKLIKLLTNKSSAMSYLSYVCDY